MIEAVIFKFILDIPPPNNYNNDEQENFLHSNEQNNIHECSGNSQCLKRSIFIAVVNSISKVF